MQSTQSLCHNCQQNPATTTARVTLDLVEAYNRLCSEYTISEIQTKEVEGLLLAADKGLNDYKSAILHLQSRIAYIETQQARLGERAHRLRSLISPVRRLPNEILCRIFDYSCETNLLQEFPWGGDDSSPSTVMSAPALAYLPAMTISSVCSWWRSIAVSLPRLWSRVSLEVSLEGASPSGLISAIELHLSRSGDHPLELTVNVNRDDLDHDLSILNILHRHCHRWRSFRLLGQSSFSDLVGPLIDPPLELPLLEELEFEDYASGSDLEYFEGAPMIHSLSMGGFDELELPLLQNCLIDLDIPINKTTIDSALEKYSKLTRLRLWESPGLSDQAMPPCIPPKRYETLTSLALFLAKTDNQAGQAALHSLTLPSLVDLELKVSKYGPRRDTWATDALITFLQRSTPSNLTTFVVQSVVITDSDLVGALRFMPCLINLTIDDATVPLTESPITPRLINSLHGFTPSTLQPHKSTALLPKLRSLKLYSDGISFDDAAFIDMVSSRWLPDAQYASAIGISCLQTVVMSFRMRAVDEKVYQPLHLLDIAGMMTAVISQGRMLML